MKTGVPSDYNKRKLLIASGILEEQPDGYHLQVDHVFSSPSQAAGVCAGRSANGRTEWKDARGKTLKEHQQRALEG